MIMIERRELLDAFRRGDQDALLAVYRHFVQDVARFLTRGFSFTSGGRHCSFRGFQGGYEMEAALQEVFRKAFEERARLAYNGIDPYRPYLLRIARNLIINDLKSKNPILFRFRSGGMVILGEGEPDPTGAATSPAPSPEEVLEAQEITKLIKTFKDQLGKRDLGVFRCRFEQGQAAEATAKELGLTRSKVRTTETKLRAQFLQMMQSSGYLAHYKKHPNTKSALPTLAVLLLRVIQ